MYVCVSVGGTETAVRSVGRQVARQVGRHACILLMFVFFAGLSFHIPLMDFIIASYPNNACACADTL